MKKKDFLWSMLTMMMVGLLSLTFTACGDDDDDPELTVSPLDINFNAEGGSKSVTVTAKETDWSIEVTRGDEWLTANKNGNQASLRASKNEGTQERTGSVRITATADGKLTYTVNVTQEAASGSILIDGTSSSANRTFEGNFGGNSGIVFKQSLQIVSNVQWNAQVSYETAGQTNWLSISPTTGKGTVTMDIYPTSENPASSDREATITLSGEGVNNTIKVVQHGGKPVCYVLPANEIALYDRIGWEYTATSNVNKFQWILLSEREYNRMTDNELIEELSKEEELKYVDEYLSFVAYDSHDNRIAQSSTYYLVTIAYDGDGKAGELKKTRIKTPAFLNVDNDAWVNFDNVSCNYSQGFWFDAIKEGYCNTYHLIYGIQTETYNSVVYAFEINYYLKNKKKHWLAENWEMEIVTDYPNNHTFTYSTTLLSNIPICFAYGWGVFKDGSISSDLVGFQWDTSKEEARRLNVRNNDRFQNITYRRSSETERAKKMRQMRK